MVVNGGRFAFSLERPPAGADATTASVGAAVTKSLPEFIARMTKEAATNRGCHKYSARPMTAPSGEPVPAQQWPYRISRFGQRD
jgi:hypothetical protein